MLILERKVGERVLIGDDIVLIVTKIDPSGTRVKIGFEAPRDMKILRAELISTEKNPCPPTFNTK